MKLPPEHVPGKGLVRPTGYGGYGEKMLRSMGWEKGQGLGMEKQGIKEAIRVKKKQDNVGVRCGQGWTAKRVGGCRYCVSIGLSERANTVARRTKHHYFISYSAGGRTEVAKVGRQLVGPCL